MFLTFLVILSLLGFGLFFSGFLTKEWSLVLIGAIVILTTGAIVEAEGVSWYPTVDTLGYDGTTPVTLTESFTNYTYTNSFEVLVIKNLYIYGGFLFILLSLVAMLNSAGFDNYERQAYAEW